MKPIVVSTDRPPWTRTFRGLADRHLTVISTAHDSRLVWLAAQTSQSRIRVAVASRTQVRLARSGEPPRRWVADDGTSVAEWLSFTLTAGEEAIVDKRAAIYTSRDRAILEPVAAARDEAGAAGGFDQLLAEHTAAWQQLWSRFQLRISDGMDTQLAVNLHVFHALQTLSPHTADLDVGVPARGLHGEGYRGHIFWDELFVLPFMHLRVPELSRSLLLYRYRRLPRARSNAERLGAKGCLFPWQSGSDGREENPMWFFNPMSGRWMPDNSHLQYHVNLAVAYNVWRYWETTADLSFLASYGAEMLVGIARFFRSIATYDTASDRYDIRGVMGPDEFHDGYPDRPGDGVDNNAYVNVMTAWVLGRALDAYRILGEQHSAELWRRLDVSPTELAAWDHLRTRLRICFLDNGIPS